MNYKFNDFQLQLFGGKGGSSTTVESAKPTDEEKRLQAVQANYSEQTAPTALALQKMGSNMILSNPGVVPVDYTNFGNTAVNNATNLQNNVSSLGNNISGLSNTNNSNIAAGNSLYSNLGNANANNAAIGNGLYSNLTNTNNANTATNNGLYSNLYSNNSANSAANNAMYGGLSNYSNANQSTGVNNYNNLTTAQNALNTNNADSMSGLLKGLLPEEYAKNQQYAINRGTQTAVGDLLARNAANGVINSSAMNTGVQGISDSVANTMSQNYNQNMNTAASMQNQNANQQQTGQNFNLGVANNLNSLLQQGYGNQSVIVGGLSNANQQSLANQAQYANYLTGANQQSYANQGNIADSINNLNQSTYGNNANLANNQVLLNQQGLTNQGNIYNQLANNYSQQEGLLSKPMALANSAQNASIDIPAKLLALSQGQQADTSSLLNTLSTNRINDKTTTQTNEGTGLLGGLLGGAGNYFGAIAACFIAGTKISTPTGLRNIEDIQVGDKVVTPVDGIQTVTYTMKPCISPDEYMTVIENGRQVTTTATQPFITPDGDKYPHELNNVPADKELVYDLSTTGSNTYYANGFAVRGAIGHEL